MKNLALFFLLFISVQSVFSQTDKKIGTPRTEIIQTSVPDPAITQIVKNINIARDNNDVVSKLYWEAKLNEITKPQIINQSPDISNFKSGEENQNSSQSLNLTTITGNKVVANSISRERVRGDIYAAIGFKGTVVLSDTLKIFRSTNNGISFSFLTSFTSSNLVIVPNGLDIEAVSNGDSSYAFVAMSHTTLATAYSTIVRVRQDGLMQGAVTLPSTATKKYTNIRLTSDNSRWSFNAYVFISVTLDSLAAGTRRLKSKLYRIVSPFAPGLQVSSGFQHPVGGYYGYQVTGAAPDTAKFETDIAFVSSEDNTAQLCTVTIVRGVPGSFGNGSNLYFTKDVNLGAAASALFSTGNSDEYLKESPRFAATGFFNNSAMVAARGLFGGDDWDAFYFYTSDITSGAPAFDLGYVEGSSNITLGVSVAANYRSNGSYLFAFNNRSGLNTGNIFIKSFTGGVASPSVQVNPLSTSGTNTQGAPDAGFRNVNSDSCLVIWAGSTGSGSYVTGGCDGPFIGIHSSNSITDGYHLSQNYPNPFNPVTNINYVLPIKGFVTLKIYDVLGTEVMQLVNEVKQAGNYNVTFDVKSLPSGTYFYKLTSDKFSDVKKMVVVK